MGDTPGWIWIVFGVLLFGALATDLFSHRGERADTHRRAAMWASVWIGLGLSFCVFIWITLGGQKAGEYLAAYLIEESLSVDNLFVFLIIFQSLKIGPENQRVVLTWGIFGALVFRFLFIVLGTEAIERWHWVVYVFGAILIVAAIKIFREDPGEKTENKAVAWLSRHLPLTTKVHGHRFFIVENGRRLGTPLLVAVLGLELTDIMFAVDSVPAAFSVSTDKFIIYSSNAFAILGLRSLYIVLARSLADFKYLHYGLAGVLLFAGLKLIFSEWVHIPAPISIGVIVLFIGGAIGASLRHRKKAAASPDAKKPLADERPAHQG